MDLKAYEILFIILPDFSEEQRSKITEELQSWITTSKGSVLEFNEMGLRDFAMELKKNRQGYYYTFQFQMDPANLKTVQNNLRLSEKIFRYMIVTLDSVLSKEALQQKIGT